MVFCNSLKDVRPTAPKVSCGSGAGQTRPIAHRVPIRVTQPDIAFRCCWALLPVRRSASEPFFSKQPKPYIAVRQHGEQSRLFAQEM